MPQLLSLHVPQTSTAGISQMINGCRYRKLGIGMLPKIALEHVIFLQHDCVTNANCVTNAKRPHPL